MEVGNVSLVAELDTRQVEQQIEQFKKQLDDIKLDIPATIDFKDAKKQIESFSKKVVKIKVKFDVDEESLKQVKEAIKEAQEDQTVTVQPRNNGASNNSSSNSSTGVNSSGSNNNGESFNQDDFVQAVENAIDKGMEKGINGLISSLSSFLPPVLKEVAQEVGKVLTDELMSLLGFGSNSQNDDVAKDIRREVKENTKATKAASSQQNSSKDECCEESQKQDILQESELSKELHQSIKNVVSGLGEVISAPLKTFLTGFFEQSGKKVFNFTNSKLIQPALKEQFGQSLLEGEKRNQVNVLKPDISTAINALNSTVGVLSSSIDNLQGNIGLIPASISDLSSSIQFVTQQINPTTGLVSASVMPEIDTNFNLPSDNIEQPLAPSQKQKSVVNTNFLTDDINEAINELDSAQGFFKGKDLLARAKQDSDKLAEELSQYAIFRESLLAQINEVETILKKEIQNIPVSEKANSPITKRLAVISRQKKKVERSSVEANITKTGLLKNEEVQNVLVDTQQRVKNKQQAISQGIEVGLNINQKQSLNRIRNFGQLLLDAFSQKLEIRSPSKAFMRLATQINLGIIQGLMNGGDKSLQVMAKNAQGLINTFKDELDINSPSKRLEELAKLVNLGIRHGLKDTDGIQQEIDHITALLAQITKDEEIQKQVNVTVTETVTQAKQSKSEKENELKRLQEEKNQVAFSQANPQQTLAKLKIDSSVKESVERQRLAKLEIDSAKAKVTQEKKNVVALEVQRKAMMNSVKQKGLVTPDDLKQLQAINNQLSQAKLKLKETINQEATATNRYTQETSKLAQRRNIQAKFEARMRNTLHPAQQKRLDAIDKRLASYADELESLETTEKQAIANRKRREQRIKRLEQLRSNVQSNAISSGNKAKISEMDLAIKTTEADLKISDSDVINSSDVTNKRQKQLDKLLAEKAKLEKRNFHLNWAERAKNNKEISIAEKRLAEAQKQQAIAIEKRDNQKSQLETLKGERQTFVAKVTSRLDPKVTKKIEQLDKQIADTRTKQQQTKDNKKALEKEKKALEQTIRDLNKAITEVKTKNPISDDKKKEIDRLNQEISIAQKANDKKKVKQLQEELKTTINKKEFSPAQQEELQRIDSKIDRTKSLQKDSVKSIQESENERKNLQAKINKLNTQKNRRQLKANQDAQKEAQAIKQSQIQTIQTEINDLKKAQEIERQQLQEQKAQLNQNIQQLKQRQQAIITAGKQKRKNAQAQASGEIDTKISVLQQEKQNTQDLINNQNPIIQEQNQKVQQLRQQRQADIKAKQQKEKERRQNAIEVKKQALKQQLNIKAQEKNTVTQQKKEIAEEINVASNAKQSYRNKLNESRNLDPSRRDKQQRVDQKIALTQDALKEQQLKNIQIQKEKKLRLDYLAQLQKAYTDIDKTPGLSVKQILSQRKKVQAEIDKTASEINIIESTETKGKTKEKQLNRNLSRFQDAQANLEFGEQKTIRNIDKTINNKKGQIESLNKEENRIAQEEAKIQKQINNLNKASLKVATEKVKLTKDEQKEINKYNAQIRDAQKVMIEARKTQEKLKADLADTNNKIKSLQQQKQNLSSNVIKDEATKAKVEFYDKNIEQKQQGIVTTKDKLKNLENSRLDAITSNQNTSNIDTEITKVKQELKTQEKALKTVQQSRQKTIDLATQVEDAEIINNINSLNNEIIQERQKLYVLNQSQVNSQQKQQETQKKIETLEKNKMAIAFASAPQVAISKKNQDKLNQIEKQIATAQTALLEASKKESTIKKAQQKYQEQIQSLLQQKQKVESQKNNAGELVSQRKLDDINKKLVEAKQKLATVIEAEKNSSEQVQKAQQKIQRLQQVKSGTIQKGQQSSEAEKQQMIARIDARIVREKQILANAIKEEAIATDTRKKKEQKIKQYEGVRKQVQSSTVLNDTEKRQQVAQIDAAIVKAKKELAIAVQNEATATDIARKQKEESDKRQKALDRRKRVVEVRAEQATKKVQSKIDADENVSQKIQKEQVKQSIEWGMKKIFNFMGGQNEESEAMMRNAGAYVFSLASAFAPLQTATMAVVPVIMNLLPIITAIGSAFAFMLPILNLVGSSMQQIDAMLSRFNAISIDPTVKKGEFDYVRGVAKEYGLPVDVLSKEYTGLNVAAKNTKLEGRQTKELFEGITIAAKAMNLSGYEAELMFNAFTQIISKGKLSMEELRQQLGEKFPPAMSVFAKALGVSNSELNDLIGKGNVLSEDVIPDVTKVLKADYGTAAAESAKTFTSAMNSLQNTFLDLKIQLVEGYGGIFITITRLANFLLNVITENAKAIQLLINTFAIGITAVIAVGTSVILQIPMIRKQIDMIRIVFATAITQLGTSLIPLFAGIGVDLMDKIANTTNSVMENMFGGISNAISSLIVMFDQLKRNITGEGLFSPKIKEEGEGIVGVFKALGNAIPKPVIEMLALIIMFEQAVVLGKMFLTPMFQRLSRSLQDLVIDVRQLIKAKQSLKTSMTEIFAVTSKFLMKALLVEVALAYLVMGFARGEIINKFTKQIHEAQRALHSLRAELLQGLKPITVDVNYKDKNKPSLRDLPSKGFQINPFSETGMRTDDLIKKGIPLIDVGLFTGMVGMGGNVIQPKDRKLLEENNLDSYIPSVNRETVGLRHLINDLRDIDTLVKDVNENFVKGIGFDPSNIKQTMEKMFADNLEQLATIDAEIERLGEKKSKYGWFNSSDDKKAINDLDVQIQELLKKRGDAFFELEIKVKEVNQAEEVVNQLIQNIDESNDPILVKEVKKKKLQPVIDAIEQIKKGLKDVGATDALQPLENKWLKLNNQITDMNTQTDRFLNQLESSGANQRASLYQEYRDGFKDQEMELRLNVVNIDLESEKLEQINKQLALLERNQQELLKLPDVDMGVKKEDMEKLGQQIKQLRTERNNLTESISRQTRDYTKQLIQYLQDLRGFKRSLEDLDTAVKDFLTTKERAKEDVDVGLRDFKLQKVRGLEDFARQLEDASIQYQRQQRDLIESYQDLSRQLITQTFQIRKTIDETTRDIQRRSALNAMRQNLDLGGQGLFSTVFDAIDQFITSQNDLKTEELTIEEQRLQIQEDVISLAKQIRGMQEQIFDMERQRLLQLRDLMRQQVDLINGQLDAQRNINRQLADFAKDNKERLRAITRQFEDMESQARSMGFKFDDVMKAFKGINTNYNTLNGAISNLINNVNQMRSKTQKELENSRNNPNLPQVSSTPPTVNSKTPVTKPLTVQPQSATVALKLLNNIPLRNIGGTNEQKAISTDLVKVISQGIKDGLIVINANQKGEIKSIEAKNARLANILGTGNANSGKYDKGQIFVYNSKQDTQLGTVLNNIRTWMSRANLSILSTPERKNLSLDDVNKLTKNELEIQYKQLKNIVNPNQEQIKLRHAIERRLRNINDNFGYLDNIPTFIEKGFDDVAQRGLNIENEVIIASGMAGVSDMGGFISPDMIAGRQPQNPNNRQQSSLERRLNQWWNSSFEQMGGLLDTIGKVLRGSQEGFDTLKKHFSKQKDVKANLEAQLSTKKTELDNITDRLNKIINSPTPKGAGQQAKINALKTKLEARQATLTQEITQTTNELTKLGVASQRTAQIVGGLEKSGMFIDVGLQGAKAAKGLIGVSNLTKDSRAEDYANSYGDLIGGLSGAVVAGLADVIKSQAQLGPIPVAAGFGLDMVGTDSVSAVGDFVGALVGLADYYNRTGKWNEGKALIGNQFKDSSTALKQLWQMTTANPSVLLSLLNQLIKRVPFLGELYRGITRQNNKAETRKETIVANGISDIPMQIFPAEVDIPDVSPIINNIQNGVVTDEKQLEEILQLQNNALDSINLKKLEQQGYNLTILKLEDLALKKIQLSLKATDQQRQSANALANALRQQVDLLRQMLETYRGLQNESMKLSMNAKGYLLTEEQRFLALFDVQEKYRSQIRAVADFKRDIDVQVETSDPEQIRQIAMTQLEGLMKSSTFAGFPEEAKAQFNSLFSDLISGAVDGTQALMALSPQLEKILNDLKEAQKIEEIFTKFIVDLDIEIDSNNKISNIANDLAEGFDIFDKQKAVGLRIMVKEMEVFNKHLERRKTIDADIARSQEIINNPESTNRQLASAKRLLAIRQDELANEVAISKAIIARSAREIQKARDDEKRGNEVSINRTIGDKQREMNPFGGGSARQAEAERVEIAQRYADEMERIKKMQESNDYSETLIAGLRRDIEAIRNYDLSKVEEKFNIFAQAIREPMQQAFTSLFSDVIRGTKSIGDVFNEFLNQVANFFANIAAQIATSQVMGFFKNLGIFSIGGIAGGSSAIGGAVGGLGSDFISSATNSIASGITIPTFNDGGEINNPLSRDKRMFKLPRFRMGSGNVRNISIYKNGGAISHVSNFNQGGTVENNSIPTFNNGGIINTSMINSSLSNMMTSYDMGLVQGIYKAMQKEGSGAMPIVVHAGEQVLTDNNWDAQAFRHLQQTGKWNDIKQSIRYQGDISNFDMGGTVGNMTTNSSLRSPQGKPQGTVYNYAINVTTKDADSFRKSQSLIAQEQKMLQERRQKFN